MVNLITFGDVNKYLFYPFVGGIVKLLLEFISDKVKKDFTNHPIINLLNESFGFSLALIPLLIVHIRTKRLNKEYTLSITKTTEKAINNNNGFFDNKRTLLILCSLFIYIQKFFTYFIIHNYMTNLWFYDVVFLSIFSWLILGERLYKHQFLCLIILAVISAFILYFSYKEANLLDVCIIFYIELIFCITHVLIKYVIDNKFCTVYEVCSYEGVLSFIINFILLIIFSNIEIDRGSKFLKVFYHLESDGKIYYDNYNYFSQWTGYEIIIFFVFSIIRTLYNLTLLFTLKYFIPSHIIIILLSDEIYDSLKMDATGNKYYITFTCLIYPFIYFLILIFTEIIELNFLGLSYNTRKNIRRRASFTERSSSAYSRHSNLMIEMEDNFIVNMREEDNEI